MLFIYVGTKLCNFRTNEVMEVSINSNIQLSATILYMGRGSGV